MPCTTIKDNAAPAGRASQFGDTTRLTPSIQPLPASILIIGNATCYSTGLDTGRDYTPQRK